jgi:hypothetical protein
MQHGFAIVRIAWRLSAFVALVGLFCLPGGWSEAAEPTRPNVTPAPTEVFPQARPTERATPGISGPTQSVPLKGHTVVRTGAETGE